MKKHVENARFRVKLGLIVAEIFINQSFSLPGAIGALSLLCAKAMGAMQIVATDISEHRLAMIKELGADFTVNVANKSPKEAAEAIKQAMGCALDTALECTGFGVSIE